MDEQLAAIYGTGQQEVEENDLEKTAAAELLVKLAEEQGVSLDDFSDEEIGEMLSDLYGGGIEHTAEQVDEAADEESQEKVAEADYLGRVMAHAMVQELNSIEKEAAAPAAAKAVGEFFKNRPKAYRKAGKALKQAVTGKQKGLFDKLKPGTRAKRLGQAVKAVSPELGTAAGLTAAGVGAAKMKKESSALEALAEQRAYELAAEAGYVKEASALDLEVERRALEICEENGIPVEWNE